MAFENTSTRLWKKLTREERVAAATSFWQEPPSALVPAALAAIIGARKLRPQAARALPPEQQAKILASLQDPGEPLAGLLIAALHLAERRALLRAFLDAAGIPHEDGMLKAESDDVPVSEETLAKAVKTISAQFPRHEVELYLNALWLQDPDK